GVRLVMGMVLLRAADDLAVERVLHLTLNPDDHRLVGLVGNHCSRQHALGHRCFLYFAADCVAVDVCARCARAVCRVLIRAMSRRTSRTRLGFSSWLVAAWKRRL